MLKEEACPQARAETISDSRTRKMKLTWLEGAPSPTGYSCLVPNDRAYPLSKLDDLLVHATCTPEEGGAHFWACNQILGWYCTCVTLRWPWPGTGMTCLLYRLEHPPCTTVYNLDSWWNPQKRRYYALIGAYTIGPASKVKHDSPPPPGKFTIRRANVLRSLNTAKVMFGCITLTWHPALDAFF